MGYILDIGELKLRYEMTSNKLMWVNAALEVAAVLGVIGLLLGALYAVLRHAGPGI